MKNYIKTVLLLIFLFTVTACSSSGDSSQPLQLRKISSSNYTENLIVMFPGINSPGSDFIDYGFTDLYKQYYKNSDIILADTRFSYIKADNIAERIHADIIKPSIKAGYKKIWFIGISLGGLNILKYVKKFNNHINGIILIAPYLGETSSIKSLFESNSYLEWSKVHAEETDKTIQLWRYLIDYTSSHDKAKQITLALAFGKKDRFNKTHELLAKILKEKNIYKNDGGHNWKAWKQLWEEILQSNIIKY